MTGWPESPQITSLLLPGRPDDYLGTVVMDDGLLTGLEDRAGIEALLSDGVPLPRTEARDGHSGDRHLEYWLSGWRDARSVTRALGLEEGCKRSVLGLEYAGCGRVTRHVARDLPHLELFCGASDPVQVRVLNAIFEPRVRAFQGAAFPYLPFSDASFDGAFAFSTLPSTLGACAWLLELRRVLKREAKLYATVDDPETWLALVHSPEDATPLHAQVPTALKERPQQSTTSGLARSHTRFPLQSAFLNVLARVFRIEAAEARSKRDEIGIVLSA